MSGYIGEAPLPLVTQVLTAGDFTSATDTIPIPGGYTVGNIKVYINGDRLRQVDFTANDGINVVLGAVFPIGTSYEVEEQRGFLQSEAAPVLNANFLSMPAVNGDPIVESGSNADGEWTRWADGTQQVTGSTSEIAGDGSLQSRTVAFAAAFFVSPSVQVSWQISANVHYDATYQGVDTNTVTVFTSPTSSATGYVKVMAYGRWK